MLEFFAHLDKDDPPDDLVLAVARVPKDVYAERVEVSEIPRNWRDPAAPAELTSFGDGFARRRKHCLLLVPSVIVPSENNCLLNPAHPDFHRIAVQKPERLIYDPRMFGDQPAPRKRRGR